MHEGIHIALKSEQVASLFGISITNTLLMSWVVMAVLCIGGYFIGKNLQKIPNKLQTFFETVFSFLIDYVEEVLDSRKLAKKFFPLLVTIFLFILLGNWFGLLPGINSVTVEQPAVATNIEYAVDAGHLSEDYHGLHESHDTVEAHRVSLFYPVSVDLNFTIALAIIAFISIEISGIMYVGALNYAGKFINFRSPVGFLVGIIELVSEVARIVSFSFRLFGNMFAGKTLIIVAMFFVPLLLPVPLMFYEVFVGFIQASIFALLTLFFIKLAISEVH